MSEGCEDGNKGSFLVRVRAQVMKRDDSTGGWLPMGEGGLSSVSVHPTECLDENNPTEYLISGRRISDHSEVFRCLIKKDFEYNKVMPTFHHWKTGDKKFGLTFQTAADARAFDRGVRLALMKVADICNGQPEDIMQNYPAPQCSRSKARGGLSLNAQQTGYDDMGDDEVFMAVDLPMERGSSQSSSDSASTRPMSGHHVAALGAAPGSALGTAPGTAPGAVPCTAPCTAPGALPGAVPCTAPCTAPGALPGAVSGTAPGAKGSPEAPRCKDPPGCGSSSDNYSYVQLTSVHHEYIYPPVVDDRRCDSLKKRNFDNPMGVSPDSQPPLPAKKKDQPLRCRHCNLTYSEEENVRGSCEAAQERCLSVVNTVSCMYCARCMLYHCMKDSEGHFPQRPCACDPLEEQCGRRWIGMTLLSILVPCLLLYPPLRGCQLCCLACGLCGRKHEPS